MIRIALGVGLMISLNQWQVGVSAEGFAVVYLLAVVSTYLYSMGRISPI